MADRGRGTRMGKQWVGGGLPFVTNFTAAGTSVGSITAATTAQTVLRMLLHYGISPADGAALLEHAGRRTKHP